MKTFDIAAQRLSHQRISKTALQTASDVVTWLVAVQAQDYAGAKWALGLRMRTATDTDIERAFNAGAILRTHVMRPTWHFVTPDDIRWLLALTAPRVHTLNAHMYRKLELDDATCRRSNTALAKALRGGKQLTRDELRRVLQKAGIAADDNLRMIHIMQRAELDGVVCSGARRGNRFTYALLDDRAPRARILKREEALAELARRYFVSRGPATVQDLAKWSGLTVRDAGRGLDAVKAALQREVISGQEYWSPSTTRSSRTLCATAYLLSVYDEYFSSYKDRSGIGGAEIGAMLRALGNSLYIIVINGRIAGTWRRTLKRDAVIVEISSFASLTKAEKSAVTSTARRYSDFLRLPLVLSI